MGTGNTEKGTTGPTVDPTQLWSILSPLTPITTSSPFLGDPGIRGPFHSHGAVAQGGPTLQMFKFWLWMVRATWRECSGFRSQKPMPCESLLTVEPQQPSRHHRHLQNGNLLILTSLGSVRIKRDHSYQLPARPRPPAAQAEMRLSPLGNPGQVT